MIYRIKPLEWSRFGDTWISRDRYFITRYHRSSFEARDTQFHIAAAKTLEEAKAACETHRRKLLEAELEPVYYPSTDLPTEPGLYWWRSDRESKWHPMFIERDPLNRLISQGPAWNGMIVSLGVTRGQWVRIHEPEAGL